MDLGEDIEDRPQAQQEEFRGVLGAYKDLGIPDGGCLWLMDLLKYLKYYDKDRIRDHGERLPDFESQRKALIVTVRDGTRESEEYEQMCQRALEMAIILNECTLIQRLGSEMISPPAYRRRRGRRM